ncbi:MAG: undecaprenyl diphosphate synthase family protein [Methanomicrobiales archaeon]|nr:undecaprenyl diphosphate synthase family protein [Methanomicrobiales archaeon]
MIYWLYEWWLRRGLRILPSHLCFLISERDMIEAPEKILEVTEWCLQLGMQGMIFHIATRNPSRMDEFLPLIRGIGGMAELHLHRGEKDEVSGSGARVDVAIGKSGREEIAASIRKMAYAGIAPEEVDEEKIESFLTFRMTPDLLIKTGESHLTDFLIWQSVYSELFFFDVNWKYFRRVDLLRALRDFQSRERRFGG